MLTLFVSWDYQNFRVPSGGMAIDEGITCAASLLNGNPRAALLVLGPVVHSNVVREAIVEKRRQLENKVMACLVSNKIMLCIYIFTWACTELVLFAILQGLGLEWMLHPLQLWPTWWRQTYSHPKWFLAWFSLSFLHSYMHLTSTALLWVQVFKPSHWGWLCTSQILPKCLSSRSPKLNLVCWALLKELAWGSCRIMMWIDHWAQVPVQLA